MTDHDYKSDDEDYGLEYSEDSTSEPDVDLENQYYHSKAIKEEEPVAALAAFQKVIDLQGPHKGEWGFKALKQIVKINFKLKNYEETIKRYKEMLSYIKNAVTKNHGEKSINSILVYTSSTENIEVLQQFYETTLDTLKHTKNDRLWFKTNAKLGKVFLERGEFGKVANIVRQLYQCCQTETGEDDVLKGTQLLEIYALQIQMYTEQKNHKLLKELYDRSLRVRSAIPHPLIMSVIRECGGKMHLRAGDYEQAYTDFFEAFKNYDESGNPRRTTCLKYLILTSMLMKSAINPFDSQEAKPYKLDVEVQAMTDLITAYQNNDMKQFEKCFRENRESLLKDPFIRENIEVLLKNVRTQVLLVLVKPYRRVTLSYISRELNISDDETEHVIISCILDGLLKGRIDQVNQVFIKNTNKNEAQQDRYNVLKTLTDRIDKIHKALTVY